MYKLLALDIDDTLLDSKRRLSKTNQNAVQRACAAGVTVTISTGRMHRASTQYMDQLGISGPIITYGGAQVTHHPSGEILCLHEVPLPLAREVVAFAREVGGLLHCYSGDNFYYDTPSEYSDFYGKVMGFSGIHADLMTAEFARIPKLLMIADPARMKELIPFARERFEGRLEITLSKPNYMEFNAPGINKGTAVQELAEKLGIARDEVIAMGDSLNDNEMIEYAGLGVCVANGREETKAVADYIAPDCDHDAVAHVIDKFIFQKG